jgi:hypothetical protein
LTCSSSPTQNEVRRSEEGAMPKMYRIVSGGSFTWEYVDAARGDGESDPRDKVLARSSENPWETEDKAAGAIAEMKKAKVKRRGRPPE